MSRKDTQIVATAGEHFVAFRLAQLGFVVAMPRANTPAVDLMVTNLDGMKTALIQVKTAEWAERWQGKRGKDKVLHHLEFALGHKAAHRSDPSLFYAFVDLQGREASSTPNVYVVPSKFIKESCEAWADKVSMVRWHPSIEVADSFKNNWDLLKAILK